MSNTTKLILGLGFILALCQSCAMAQTKVIQDAKGNYKPFSRDTAGDNKPTGKTFTDKQGNTHPVYIAKLGGLYYLRTSKKGVSYRAYIIVATQ